MDNGLHFIAGLPRSDSTLLAAILRQNPHFHAAMSSPVASLFMAIQTATGRRNETSIFIDEDRKTALPRSILDASYHAIHPGKVVFDTTRAWCSKLSALVKLVPTAKIRCCVRDVWWIVDSFERLVQANPLDLAGMVSYDPSTTIDTRVNRLAASDGVIGYALDALREAYFGPHSDRLMLEDYEALIRNPRDTLGQLCAFVEQLWFERKSVLPPHVFDRFANEAFWMGPSLNTNAVPVILPQSAGSEYVHG